MALSKSSTIDLEKLQRDLHELAREAFDEPTAKGRRNLADLRDEAQRHNHGRYLHLLQHRIRDLLQRLKVALEPLVGKGLVLSFHYSSLVLRQWLRVEDN